MGTSVQRNDPLFANVLNEQRDVPWRLKDLILAIQGTMRPWNSVLARDAPCEDRQGPYVDAFRLFRCGSGGLPLLRVRCQERNSPIGRIDDQRRAAVWPDRTLPQLLAILFSVIVNDSRIEFSGKADLFLERLNGFLYRVKRFPLERSRPFHRGIRAVQVVPPQVWIAPRSTGRSPIGRWRGGRVPHQLGVRCPAGLGIRSVRCAGRTLRDEAYGHHP